MSQRKQKSIEDILRVIELCKAISRSSTNPFEVDIVEKIRILRDMLPQYKFLNELLLDAEALYQLTTIVKLQDEYLKRKASSMYIDPLLLELKLRLLPNETLALSLIKSMHPIANIDQVSPKGLERAFVYYRDLLPLAERFRKEEVEVKETKKVDFGELISLGVISKEMFEKKLKEVESELIEKSGNKWIDYYGFIEDKDFSEKIGKAYFVSFIVSEGRAELRIDPITGKVFIRNIEKIKSSEVKSVPLVIN